MAWQERVWRAIGAIPAVSLTDAFWYATMAGLAWLVFYGLYFNFWDRLLGTNHPQYAKRFAAVSGGENAQAAAAGANQAAAVR